MSNWLQIATPFTQTEEGCRLTAYPDPVSGGDPWTIGYGATGPHIVEGLVWTQEQADADLQARLTVLGDTILAAASVNLNDNQLAALVDFAYNEGLWALLNTSTLWRLLQQGDYDDSDIQAFFYSYNALAQTYLDWFNQTPIGVYTNANISGPLLDWIANGLVATGPIALMLTGIGVVIARLSLQELRRYALWR